MSKKNKKKKSLLHLTYNQKAFLVPTSINSLAAIHCKIDDKGIAKVTISDCNNSMRIWNDFNTNEGKREMVEKLDTLIIHLQKFKAEVILRSPAEVFLSVKIYDSEFEDVKNE
jgi:hypothetical protein